MTKHSINRAPGLALTLLAALNTSCMMTFEHRIEYRPIANIGSIAPIEGKIVLLLTDEFANSEFKYSLGDTGAYPMGCALTQHAETICKALYPELVVIHANTVPPDATGLPVLTPRLSRVSFPQKMMMWKGMTVTTSLEWRLNDGSGEVVWVGTSDGQGTITKGGTAFLRWRRLAEAIEASVTDAYRNSYASIGAAEEIGKVLAN